MWRWCCSAPSPWQEQGIRTILVLYLSQGKGDTRVYLTRLGKYTTVYDKCWNSCVNSPSWDGSVTAVLWGRKMMLRFFLAIQDRIVLSTLSSVRKTPCQFCKEFVPSSWFRMSGWFLLVENSLVPVVITAY